MNFTFTLRNSITNFICKTMSETNATSLVKRKELRSELFTLELFEEKDFPPEHKHAKTYREVRCLNCP